MWVNNLIWWLMHLILLCRLIPVIPVVTPSIGPIISPAIWPLSRPARIIPDVWVGPVRINIQILSLGILIVNRAATTKAPRSRSDSGPSTTRVTAPSICSPTTGFLCSQVLGSVSHHQQTRQNNLYQMKILIISSLIVIWYYKIKSLTANFILVDPVKKLIRRKQSIAFILYLVKYRHAYVIGVLITLEKLLLALDFLMKSWNDKIAQMTLPCLPSKYCITFKKSQ